MLNNPILYKRLILKQKKDLNRLLSQEEKQNIEHMLGSDIVKFDKKTIKKGIMQLLLIIVGCLVFAGVAFLILARILNWFGSGAWLW